MKINLNRCVAKPSVSFQFDNFFSDFKVNAMIFYSMVASLIVFIILESILR